MEGPPLRCPKRVSSDSSEWCPWRSTVAILGTLSRTGNEPPPKKTKAKKLQNKNKKAKKAGSIKTDPAQKSHYFTGVNRQYLPLTQPAGTSYQVWPSTICFEVTFQVVPSAKRVPVNLLLAAGLL